MFLEHASVASLVVLYWAENVVIGFYVLLRIAAAQRVWIMNRFAHMIFFTAFFGMACTVHGLLVVALFLSEQQLAAISVPEAERWPAQLGMLQTLWQGAGALGLFSGQLLLVPLLALVASHGVSYVQNYLRTGQYKAELDESLSMRPFGRVILLHLFIVLGGLYIARLGSPQLALALFVLAKTAVDVALHVTARQPT